jgi:hypothetical protein
MSKRALGGTFVAGITALLLLLVPATGGAAAAGHPCSVKGLSYTQKNGGEIEGVAVAGLRAKSVSCAKARSIAGTVAKDILHETKVPATAAGMKVTVTEPCAGCTPDSRVVAKSAGKSVVFTVKGGA